MAVEFSINLKEKGRSFPHYWELCVGSCHAATLLREDVRQQIKKAHEECGFQYIRFHGLFDDDMSVAVREMFFGDIRYSFYNIDCIFDFLLEIGMKPFIEMGFMPTVLASGSTTCFHYKGNTTLPKSFEMWEEFVKSFAIHLIERYGKEEVDSWYFEVWNEPNLNFFFDGTRSDYFRLYQSTAKALKAVDSEIRVGGPATSSNAWIPEFIEYCSSNAVPLDFITTHHYPSDDMLADFGTKDNDEASFKMPTREELEKSMTPEEIQKMVEGMMAPRENKNPRDVLRRMAEKAKHEAGKYPLIYTEWNGAVEHDTSYQAAAVAQILADNEGLVDGYSFWTVSDVFEEMGLIAAPFCDGFGMLTKHGIEKPVYRVFENLHKAGKYRINVENSNSAENKNVQVLALSDGKEVLVMIYNHDIVRRSVKTEEVVLHLQGKVETVRKAVIDDCNCNPRQAWIDMGSPEYLKEEQKEALKKAAELKFDPLTVDADEEKILQLTVQPESVTLIWIVLQ